MGEGQDPTWTFESLNRMLYRMSHCLVSMHVCMHDLTFWHYGMQLMSFTHTWYDSGDRSVWQWDHVWWDFIIQNLQLCVADRGLFKESMASHILLSVAVATQQIIPERNRYQNKWTQWLFQIIQYFMPRYLSPSYIFSDSEGIIPLLQVSVFGTRGWNSTVSPILSYFCELGQKID